MAKLPLRFIPIGALLGDYEDSESVPLPSAYSSGGSRNVFLDKYARATSILGYTRRNAAAVTSNTGGEPLRIRALYHYIYRKTDGTIERQELGIFDGGPGSEHYELRRSIDLGVTWTFVADLGVNYPERIPDFGQLGNALAIAFGYGPVKSYDGVTFADASTARLGQPFVTVGASGLLKGSYKFRIRPIKSDGTRKSASAASPPRTLASVIAQVTWDADPDDTVTGYDVYRTTGTGEIYFFDGTVDGRTNTNYTSSAADLTLIQNPVLQDHGDAPPSGLAFAEPHKGRMLYGTEDRRWYFSDPGLPYSVLTNSSFVDLTDDESYSDVSRGGTGNFKGMFVCWLERSIWTISGTGEVSSGNVINLERRRTSASVGGVSHRAVVRIPKGSVYVNVQGEYVKTPAVTLAYLTPLGDLRLFDGENDEIISTLKASTFGRLTYAARHKAWAVMDTARSLATWVFPGDGDLEPSVAVQWDLLHGTMTEVSWPFCYGLQIESEADSSILLAGEHRLATGAFAYQLWDGLLFHDQPINARVMTKTLYGQAPENPFDRTGEAGAALLQFDKRWRWVDWLVKTSGPLDLLVEYWAGEAEDGDDPYGSRTVSLPTEGLYTSDGSLIQSADGSPLRAQVVNPFLRVKFRQGTVGGPNRHRYLHSRGIRIAFSSATTSTQWSIVAMVVAYQLFKGLKREFRR